MSIGQVDLKIDLGIHKTSPVCCITANASLCSFNLVSALLNRRKVLYNKVI